MIAVAACKRNGQETCDSLLAHVAFFASLLFFWYIPVHSFVENVFNSFGSMGLKPWEHYIPINPDALTICNSLKKAMMWIKLHPTQAAAIGHVVSCVPR